MDPTYFYKNINLDITHRCKLQCHKCMRQEYPGLHKRGHDISLKSFKKICKQFKHITLCGQMGDCIYHPKFIELMLIGKRIPMLVETNGFGKSLGWWSKAFSFKNITWCFALDGLPKDSHKYRKNQNGEDVFEIMKYGVRLGAKVIWNYIVFKYNENDISVAKELAEKYNITFNLVMSSRWDKNDSFKPSKYFLEDYRNYEAVS